MYVHVYMCMGCVYLYVNMYMSIHLYLYIYLLYYIHIYYHPPLDIPYEVTPLGFAQNSACDPQPRLFIGKQGLFMIYVSSPEFSFHNLETDANH